MRCEHIKPMMNDFFDRTLSREEEMKMEGHLAVCESCRCEFQKLKKADGILREVVREMVSEIEVPPGLSRRIETILAGEQRKRMPAGRLPGFLKTPTFAAALLFTVLAAGMFSYYHPFNQVVKQSDVALRDSQSESTAQSSGQALAPEVAPPVVSQPVTPKTASKDTPQESRTYAVPDKPATGDTGKEPGKKVEEHSISPMSVQSSRSSPKLHLSEEKSVMTSAGEVFLKSGTLEDAAREVGFNPERPAYLPKGTELQDTTWLPGTVNQNYRVGQSPLTVSQSRADVKRLNTDETSRQGTTVEINGLKAVLQQQSSPHTGGNSSPETTTVSWQRGEWIFSVSGELPKDEVLKIASSLK